jgi:hypothetical protein
MQAVLLRRLAQNSVRVVQHDWQVTSVMVLPHISVIGVDGVREEAVEESME